MLPKNHILIIGTAPKECNRHAAFITKQGYRVTCASGDTQGLNIFQTIPTNLIILDEKLSSSNSQNILEQITRKTRNVPVIVLYNNVGSQKIIDTMRLGAWDVLLPPLEEKTLLMAIKTALDRAVLIPRVYSLISPNDVPFDQFQDLREKNRTLLNAKKELQSQLIRAQKMESKGLLVSGIAHDLNTVFGTIMCSTELLLEIWPENSPWHTDIQRVLTACNHGKNLVKQILHPTCTYPEKKMPLHLGHLLTDMLPLIQTTMSSRITLKTRFEADDYMINGIGEQIQQIVLNLITNAVYALRSTLRPLLEIWITNESTRASSLHRNCKQVTLTIKDNGQGIPKKNLSRIFTPLFTTKDNKEGTGLGLSMVAKIAKEHQASLFCQSHKDSGTFFQVRFPIIHNGKTRGYLEKNSLQNDAIQKEQEETAGEKTRVCDTFPDSSLQSGE